MAKQTPEYRAWADMIQRCENPRHHRYRRYGARGICVCLRWRRSFAAFLHDVGERPSKKHSLDRIDNDGHYEPGNIRWATPRVQQGNRSTARLLTYQGKTLSVTEWARALGVPRKTLQARVDRGWSAERAITTPVRKRSPKSRKRTR